jgi:predicted RNase H-like HicB family nuclease
MAKGTALVKVEIERETDGRWIAEVPALPGVMADGARRQETLRKAQALALHVLAKGSENGEPTPELAGLFAAA